MNFSALGLGFGFNGGVLLIEPHLDGFGALFVSFFDWLLRRKTPACQLVVSSPNRQFGAQRLLHVLVYCGSSPQGKVHLQLLGALVAYRLLNRLLLSRAQAASAAGLFASDAGLQGACIACVVQTQCSTNSRPAQTGLLDDLNHSNAFVLHAYDLLATFVQYFARLLAGVFFLY